MIDLSYLTEEEQEMIMAVLKRDTELKKAEEQRIKKLQKTEHDKGKLKYLTGEWFYETKTRRHRDRIHGSDIIRASMKHRNPVTILEVSEIWPSSSFLNSESKDVFIPPELSGILDEFPSQDSREDHYRLAESPQGTQTPYAQPQIKPRQNPFNSKPLGVESPKKTDGCLTSGAGKTPLASAKVQQTCADTLRIRAEQQQPDAEPHKATAKPCQTPAESRHTPAEELPPPNESPIPSNSNQNTDSPETTSFTTRPQTKKKLLLYSSHNSVMDTSNDTVARQDMSPIPRGILKYSSSSCSFTDSLSHRNSFSSQPTSPLSPENSDSSHSPPLSPSSELSSPGLLDRKQVRFCPIIQARDTGRLEVQDGREYGEHGLLDQDCTPPFEQEGEPDTNESKNTSDPLLFCYVYNEKSIGETDSEPLISAQSAPITNEAESPPPEPSILSSEKVGEFLGCGNWSDQNAYTASTIQSPFDHREDHAEPHSSQVSEPPASVVEQGGSVEPSPVRTALKQANVRPISISKSLENLASLPSREERRKNEPRSDITLSVEDVSAAPLAPSSSLADPEQMKMLSVSVPAFIQQQRNGRGSDCTSVNSFYSERQRKDSTNTYLSTSSGRASMSSVSGSVMSIYSTDFGNVEVKGTIQFAINYVQKLGEFHIFIAQCKDLAVAEPKRNRSDPYVKCYLLPDKAKLGKRKTTVKKKTLNPTYNEILRYKIPLENLKAHTLNLSVWHNDTFGRNSFLGEVDVDLSEWDFNNTHMMDYALKGRVLAQMSPKRVNHCVEMSGEMRVALRFLQQTSQSKKTPQTGEVQIWVKECKDLPAREGAIDPFVKCTVLPDTARKGRQKTRVVKRTANPVFNHTMVYDGFRPEDLREACVELTVWDHDRLSNHFIGGIRLGLGTGKSYGSGVDWMDSNSSEAGLWKRMIESQNEWVEDVVPLRMLVMARTMSK
ncbi:synaptotagmin-like protein 1 isoform X3 [Colossoma macropomum]|uniref:synaptotagmin-like protein 1 isoform X3 n=1 Tax=Colossoma macropomum TaxID=42526 RepID=UPI0018653670|nr:synaptotagmin-like protein 1 isoform X3 [Colossoma macropomum]